MKKYFLIIILLFNFTISFSQQLFDKYGDRKTVKELNVELLKVICEKSTLEFENIYLDKSFSKKYTDSLTFFSIRYITKKFEFENDYTTKFVLANNIGEIISEINNKNLSYSDNEAGQPSPTRILNKLIPLNENKIGIGLITEFSSPSKINLYSEELFSIILLDKKNLKKILDNYPIRKTIGDSNGWGDYEVEIMESLIFIEKIKHDKYWNFKALKEFKYEKHIEEDSKKNIKELSEKKAKAETEILKFNGQNYGFKKQEFKFLDNY